MDKKGRSIIFKQKMTPNYLFNKRDHFLINPNYNLSRVNHFCIV